MGADMTVRYPFGKTHWLLIFFGAVFIPSTVSEETVHVISYPGIVYVHDQTQFDVSVAWSTNDDPNLLSLNVYLRWEVIPDGYHHNIVNLTSRVLSEPYGAANFTLHLPGDLDVINNMEPDEFHSAKLGAFVTPTNNITWNARLSKDLQILLLTGGSLPTLNPTFAPSHIPTHRPSLEPTSTWPTKFPSSSPSVQPTLMPSSAAPSSFPSKGPSRSPTSSTPTANPTTLQPTTQPTTSKPSLFPTAEPSWPTSSCGCSLPFKYGGTTYTNCTSVNSSIPWCATAVTPEMEFISNNFRYCNQACEADLVLYTGRCVFPFFYFGAEYASCTDAGQRRFWCPTEVDSFGEAVLTSRRWCDESESPTSIPSFAPSTSRPTTRPTDSPVTSAPTTLPTSGMPSFSPTQSPSVACLEVVRTVCDPVSKPCCAPLECVARSNRPNLCLIPDPDKCLGTDSQCSANRHCCSKLCNSSTWQCDSTPSPTLQPTRLPTTHAPTMSPATPFPTTTSPTLHPSPSPATSFPSTVPSGAPLTSQPSAGPTKIPTSSTPSESPSHSSPSSVPSISPISSRPTNQPSMPPSMHPSVSPFFSNPTAGPSFSPSTSTSTTTTSITLTTITTSTISTYTSFAPTVVPTVDACSLFRCSRDCSGIYNGETCGWNANKNVCRSGKSTSQAERDALLETSPGDCSHYTLAPTISPSTSPTLAPSLQPTLTPSAAPIGESLQFIDGPFPQTISPDTEFYYAYLWAYTHTQPGVLRVRLYTKMWGGSEILWREDHLLMSQESTATFRIPLPRATFYTHSSGFEIVAYSTLSSEDPNFKNRLSVARKSVALPVLTTTTTFTSVAPTTSIPTAIPTAGPSQSPLYRPTASPSILPTVFPTTSPTAKPTVYPSRNPTGFPSQSPTLSPSEDPCYIYTCSRDCLGEVFRSAEFDPDSSACGWDSEFNICRRGYTTTNEEASSLLESVPGGCSQYTESPTLAPSSTPTISPSSQFPTRLPSLTPSTLAPTTSPTDDPCLLFSCSADCIAKSWTVGRDRFICGWNKEFNQCMTGFETSPDEVEALLETFTGACSHRTLVPSLGPSSLPTSMPTVSSPTRGPSLNPTTSDPTFTPTAKPTFSAPTSNPSQFPTMSRPTKSPTYVPTISPSAAPTLDPCLVHTCSLDCQNFEQHRAVEYDPTSKLCGWDSETNYCRTGYLSSTEEISALLEAVPGACSHYTLRPTSAPTEQPNPTPTAHPVKPTNTPSRGPTSFPLNSPSNTPTKNPLSSPSTSPVSAPTVYPSSSFPTIYPTSTEYLIFPEGPSQISIDNTQYTARIKYRTELPNGTANLRLLTRHRDGQTILWAENHGIRSGTAEVFISVSLPVDARESGVDLPLRITGFISPIDNIKWSGRVSQNSVVLEMIYTTTSTTTSATSRTLTTLTTTTTSSQSSTSTSLTTATSSTTTSSSSTTTTTTTMSTTTTATVLDYIRISILDEQVWTSQNEIRVHIEWRTSMPRGTGQLRIRPRQNGIQLTPFDFFIPNSGYPAGTFTARIQLSWLVPQLVPDAMLEITSFISTLFSDVLESSMPYGVSSVGVYSAPSVSPTQIPTANPSFVPTRLPSGVPSTSAPSTAPSTSPTAPTSSPTLSPSILPSFLPTVFPTTSPSNSPTYSPTQFPSSNPTIKPSTAPTMSPSASPSISPSTSPSSYPTTFPSKFPSISPTVSPTASHPTSNPTQSPSSSPTSSNPTHNPTSSPSTSPSNSPSVSPTETPTVFPSYEPTEQPTSSPMLSPTRYPSAQPSLSPTLYPSAFPSSFPTLAAPTRMPSQFPTTYPTTVPTSFPTLSPSISPSQFPTQFPSTTPTTVPSVSPSISPTFVPTVPPSVTPSESPTHAPTISAPTNMPTLLPSVSPTISPSVSPSYFPTVSAPSNTPSVFPSQIPTLSSPTATPTTAPTERPTGSLPTVSPTNSPTESPTHVPSMFPTAFPTLRPSEVPSHFPTTSPSASPTASPTENPTTSPTTTPSAGPSTVPTINPSLSPTESPSNSPTISGPTLSPSLSPTSGFPTQEPTASPSLSPTLSPSGGPTVSEPTVSPSVSPTSAAPSGNPTRVPTSSSPSYAPTISIPTTSPTKSSSPTAFPSLLPSAAPTSCKDRFTEPSSLKDILSSSDCATLREEGKCDIESNYNVCAVTCSGCRDWFVRCETASTDPSFVDFYSEDLCAHMYLNGQCDSDVDVQENCRFTCSDCSRAPTVAPTSSPTVLNMSKTLGQLRYSFEITFQNGILSGAEIEYVVTTQILAQLAGNSDGFITAGDVENVLVSSYPIEATLVFKPSVSIARVNYLRTIVLANPLVITDGFHSYTSTGVSPATAARVSAGEDCVDQTLRVMLRIQMPDGPTEPNKDEVGRSAAVALYTRLLPSAPLPRLPCDSSLKGHDSFRVGLFFDFPVDTLDGCSALKDLFDSHNPDPFRIEDNVYGLAVTESAVLNCQNITTSISADVENASSSIDESETMSAVTIIGISLAVTAVCILLIVLGVVRYRIPKTEPQSTKNINAETLAAKGRLSKYDRATASNENIWDYGKLSEHPDYDMALGLRTEFAPSAHSHTQRLPAASMHSGRPYHDRAPSVWQAPSHRSDSSHQHSYVETLKSQQLDGVRRNLTQQTSSEYVSPNTFDMIDHAIEEEVRVRASRLVDDEIDEVYSRVTGSSRSNTTANSEEGSLNEDAESLNEFYPHALGASETARQPFTQQENQNKFPRFKSTPATRY